MGPVVEANKYNASQQAIYFYQTHLGLGSPENYLDEMKLEEYMQRIMDMVSDIA